MRRSRMPGLEDVVEDGRRRLQQAVNKDSAPPCSAAMTWMPEMMGAEVRRWMMRIWLNRLSNSSPAGLGRVPDGVGSLSAGRHAAEQRPSGYRCVRAAVRSAFRTVNMRCARSMPVVETSTTWHLSSRKSASRCRCATSHVRQPLPHVLAHLEDPRLGRRRGRSAGARRSRRRGAHGLEEPLRRLSASESRARACRCRSPRAAARWRLAVLGVEVAQHAEENGQRRQPLEPVDHFENARACAVKRPAATHRSARSAR